MLDDNKTRFTFELVVTIIMINDMISILKSDAFFDFKKVTKAGSDILSYVSEHIGGNCNE